MNEKENYPVLEKFLKRKGFEIPKRKRPRIKEVNMKKNIGQKYITFDVLGYRDGICWLIECKKPCTIEQFGFSLGQLSYYKYLIENVYTPQVESAYDLPPGKLIGCLCSMALLETHTPKQEYKIGNQYEIYERILDENNPNYGFILVHDNKTFQEIRKPQLFILKQRTRGGSIRVPAEYMHFVTHYPSPPPVTNKRCPKCDSDDVFLSVSKIEDNIGMIRCNKCGHEWEDELSNIEIEIEIR
jgi:Zn ribbon nucleic-acid-binding protein